MAQAARHIELAGRYLQASALMQSDGFSNEAAEMVWGAIANAIEAIGHINTGNPRRNLSNKARRNAARSLSPAALEQYNAAQTRLHDHFYHDILNDADFQYYIANGRSYAHDLLRIALSRQSQRN